VDEGERRTGWRGHPGKRLASAIVLVLAATGCPKKHESSAADGEPAPSTSVSTGASASITVTSATPSTSSDVVSHASPYAGDAGAPVVGAGTVDGAALRAKHKARLSVATPVTLLKGGTPLELGRRLCEAVVPQRPKDTPILLKPNIGGFDWFKDPAKYGGDNGVFGRTTDPEFVRGVIRCLRARGHTKITVAEGWGATHKDWVRLVDVSGYAAMAKEENVLLVAMDDDGVFDVELDQPGKPLAISGMEKTTVPTLLMPKVLADHLDHGLYISLPKVKTHRFGVVSMAVKGMQGTVMTSDGAPAFRQKSRMHRELNALLKSGGGPGKKETPEYRLAYVAALEAFAQRMADVLEIEAPDVVLAEGAPAMGGDGFQRLWPSAEMVAIGGENAVLVDRVGAELLGLFHNESLGRELLGHPTSPIIEVAAKRFGLDLDSKDVVKVVGDGADLLSSPRPVHYVSLAGFVLQSDGIPAPPIDAPPPKKKGASDVVTAPIVHAAAVGTDVVTIDGKSDEPVWARAVPAVWESDWSGEDTGIVTHAKLAWSSDALYAFFDLEGAGFNVDQTLPTNVERPKLYVEDCVEMFVTPDPKMPRHYYEIELGPFGHWFDINVNLTAKVAKEREDIEWSSDAIIGTTRDTNAHTATIEVKIPSKAIVRALTAGARLPLGLFRMEGKGKRSYLAWSPTRTKSPNFHVPEAFGTLVLDAPP
jgi:uncharacterized protein (DUF362 family)